MKVTQDRLERPARSHEMDGRSHANEDLFPKTGWFQRRERYLLPLIVFVAILGAWELYAQTIGVDPLFFSYPSEIWAALVKLYRGPLLGDLATSGQEFAVGMLLGLAGVPIGLIVGSSRRLSLALDPLIDAAYSTPMLALTPLFVIWFGLGLTSKIAIVFIMAFFPLVINTAAGVRTLDPWLLRAARVFGAKRLHIYRDVIFPGSLPFIVSGMRLAIGRGVVGVVIGEFIASVDGIGYRIRSAAANFRTDEYLAAVVVLVAFSIVINLALKAVEKRLAPWQSGSH